MSIEDDIQTIISALAKYNVERDDVYAFQRICAAAREAESLRHDLEANRNAHWERMKQAENGYDCLHAAAKELLGTMAAGDILRGAPQFEDAFLAFATAYKDAGILSVAGDQFHKLTELQTELDALRNSEEYRTGVAVMGMKNFACCMSLRFDKDGNCWVDWYDDEADDKPKACGSSALKALEAAGIKEATNETE